MEAFITIISWNNLRSVMPPSQFSFDYCLCKTHFWEDNWQLASILKYHVYHIFNGLVPFLSLGIKQEIIVTPIPVASWCGCQIPWQVCQYGLEWVIQCSHVRIIVYHLIVSGYEVKWLANEVASRRSKAERKRSKHVQEEIGSTSDRVVLKEK